LCHAATQLVRLLVLCASLRLSARFHKQSSVEIERKQKDEEEREIKRRNMKRRRAAQKKAKIKHTG
jgi:hypothetical protein